MSQVSLPDAPAHNFASGAPNTFSSSSTYTTPTKRAPTASSQLGTSTAGPSKASAALQASPAYASNLRKHSLYGTEDRIVIDPGSRIWKVGFSGEPRPRRVFDPCHVPGDRTQSYEVQHEEEERPAEQLWDIDFPSIVEELKKDRGRYSAVVATEATGAVLPSSEGDAESEGMDENLEENKDPGGMSAWDTVELEILLRARLTKALRDTYHKHLLTDPRARKVIVLENQFLPVKIKELITSILFENLKVPSVSFTPHGIAALLAVGRTTGLVIDVGHLETTVLPIFGLRPLTSYLTTTPKAGRTYLRRLSALVRRFGSYHPPSAMKRPRIPRRTKTGWTVPEERDEDMEAKRRDGSDTQGIEGEESARVPEDLLAREVLEDIRIKACSVAITPPSRSIRSSEAQGAPTESSAQDELDEAHLVSLRNAYDDSSTLSDFSYSVPRSSSHNNTVVENSSGPARIVIPGWVRQGAAELFFNKTDGDEESVVEVILECLLRLPPDLRPIMASSMLISGGGSMLRGFLPRLHSSLILALDRKPPVITTTDALGPEAETVQPTIANAKAGPHSRSVSRTRAAAWKTRHHRPYEHIAGLQSAIAILNDPAPPKTAEHSSSGSAPRWQSHLLGWVGGSVTGTLQVAGAGVTREDFDERQNARG